MGITRFIKWLSALALTGLLAACGGGGGSAGTPILGGGTGTGASSSSTSAKLALSLSTSTVTSASPALVTATLTTAAGAPFAGQVIKFSTRDGLGTVSVASALTDATGRATTSLTPKTGSVSGADTVVASYEPTSGSSGSAITAAAGFQLTATSVSISGFTSDVTALGAYGQTALNLVLSGTNSTEPVTVTLSSSCVTLGRATLTPTTATFNTGRTTFTYRDQGCGALSPSDTIQVTVAGTSLTSSVQLNLGSPTAASIAFVSASPEVVYLKGTGLAENSNVVFQVRDANGQGLPGVDVSLSPSTLAGGLLLDDLGGAGMPITKRTDSNGQVTVRINAGTVPTPVRVIATLRANPTISTVSSNLAVAVGLPSQNNFSLSQGTINIEGYNVDGVANTYKVIASDRLGNPVPAGTAINFVAEGGQVQAVGFTTVRNGLADVTVNYQTSSPRPTDGRVTVVAYAIGEESFLDANGNNVYDAGEDYQDLGDVFIDRRFNGNYSTIDDQFVSLSIAGKSACNVAASSLLRLDATVPSRVVDQTGAAISSCESGWGRAYVRRAQQTILATSSARPVYGSELPLKAAASSLSACTASGLNLINPVDAASRGLSGPYNADESANRSTFYPVGSVEIYDTKKSGVFAFFVADANPVALNPMAAGTTVTVSATTGLTATVAGGSPIPNTASPTGVAINYSFDDTTDEGTLTISFRSPGGLVSAFSQRLVKGASPSTGMVACQP